MLHPQSLSTCRAAVEQSGEFGAALGEHLLKNGAVAPFLILAVAT
jgi:hypothetical protein